MANNFRFERFEVWQNSRKLVNSIYQLTLSFPQNERYGLTDQTRRAAVSISLNIAEGSDRRSDIEFRRYLRMAHTSIAEVVSALYIALDLKYINQKQFDSIYEQCNLISASLGAFINRLSPRSKP